MFFTILNVWERHFFLIFQIYQSRIWPLKDLDVFSLSEAQLRLDHCQETYTIPVKQVLI